MTDDIVTRLRNSGDNESPMGKGVTFKVRFPIMLEAADEIERLRADRDICLSAAEKSKQFADDATDEIERLRADRDRWRNAAHTLADHIANTSSDSPTETILRDAYEAACGL